MLLVIGPFWMAQVAGADTFQKVLLSDEFFEGEKISVVAGPPELNDQGKVVFAAFMVPSSDYFLFTGAPGSLAVLARQDSPAAGVPGEVYESFETGENRLNINPSGVVIFSGALNSATSNDDCLWSGTPGNVQLIAREDGPTPDLAGEFFGNSPFSSSDSRLNMAGNTIFRSTRKGTQPSNGIWSGAPDDPKVAAITGTPAPGVSVNFRDISRNTLSQTNRIAFYSSLNTSADKALFAGPADSLGKVFRVGEPCHGIPGLNYGGGASDAITMEYFNDDTLAYVVKVSGSGVNSTNDSALWAGPSSSPQFIIREGAALPVALGGGNFDTISFFNINAVGNLLILSRKQGTSSDTLWWSNTIGGPATWIEVAREGAPLTGLDVNLSELFTTLAISMSDNGDVIFYGRVTGTGITTANDVMLMRWSPSSQTVSKIVQEGDSIAVAPGDSRTVTNFEFSGGAGHSASMSCGVNASGQVAFSVNFGDNSKGVMIASPGGGPAAGFAEWAAMENLPVGKDGPADDANEDGVSNVMAYYAGYGGDDVLSLDDVLQWTWNAAGLVAEIRHDEAVADVSATLEISTTLTGPWDPGPALGVIDTVGNIETLSAVFPKQGNRGFVRVAFRIP